MISCACRLGPRTDVLRLEQVDSGHRELFPQTEGKKRSAHGLKFQQEDAARPRERQRPVPQGEEGSAAGEEGAATAIF